MPDIYKVNSNNIVGGSGRLVYKPYDGTFPNSIDEVIDLAAPYNLKAGWTEVGATTEGISTSRGFDTEGFEVDQQLGEVDQDITAWSHGLETTLAENTPENRKLALVGSPIIETPPTLGTQTTVTAAVAANASILSVGSVTGMSAGSFLQLSEGSNTEMKKINRITGTTVYLESPLKYAYTTAAAVRPVTKLGSRRLGYGTVTNIPTFTFVLISKKKDQSLYMAVFRKCKVTGDDKEQTFDKSKRLVPLQLTAFPIDDASISIDENVYYEIEQLTYTP